jgi:PTS system mannose-specific IIA component
VIGLVLVSHGQLAVELRRSLETIAGVQPNLVTVCVDPQDHPDERRAAVAGAIAETDDGAGVIVIADLFGATPCNLAVSLAGQPRAGRPDVDVIAGVNLPMLVEIAKLRSVASLSECVTRATDAGRHYITSASQVLAQTGTRPDRSGHFSYPGASPDAIRTDAGLGSSLDIGLGEPRSPHEIGSAAAHRAAMTQNAEAPSLP